MTKEKEIVLFETEDKKVLLPVEVKDETVWLNRNQMAVLASGRNDHSESGEINQFQPLENSQCTSATPFLS